jgi:hypothetical protein
MYGEEKTIFDLFLGHFFERRGRTGETGPPILWTRGLDEKIHIQRYMGD